MSKGFCYKTLENYDLPRDQLKSLCKYDSKAGYYNISSNRGICNSGQCRTRENFQPIPASEWQQPAAVRGTWNQVKGLYELNPQSNSCVGWLGNREGSRENYENSYYENPYKVECNPDKEEAVTIDGIGGVFCSPKCTGTTCPSMGNLPQNAGVFAQCNLIEYGNEPSRCSMSCRKNIDTCPGSATCETINDGDETGYCMYKSS